MINDNDPCILKKDLDSEFGTVIPIYKFIERDSSNPRFAIIVDRKAGSMPQRVLVQDLVNL